MSLKKLTQSDIETLIELVQNSGCATLPSRRPFCIKIGIEPNNLNFLTTTNDSDFVVELINFLTKTDNKKALCKLCEEIEPFFENGKYNNDLTIIVKKLNYEKLFSNPYIYTNLKYLLQEGQWKQANEETFNVILKIAKQEEKGYLNKDDIKRFPCAELRKIDRLWIESSSGRFGFSVQKRIWINVGGNPQIYHYETCKKFGEYVGWYAPERDKWLVKTEYNFTVSAPQGHLPVIYWYIPDGWTIIFSRANTCGL